MFWLLQEEHEGEEHEEETSAENYGLKTHVAAKTTSDLLGSLHVVTYVLVVIWVVLMIGCIAWEFYRRKKAKKDRVHDIKKIPNLPTKAFEMKTVSKTLDI